MSKGFVRVVVCASTALFMSWGCGGGGESKAPALPAPGTAAPAAKTIDPATAGSIAGMVKFEGAVPKPANIKMMADPKCHEAHSTPVQTYDVVVSAEGGLQNVFVYVKSGLDGMRFDVPAEPAHLDQHGCMYEPHVSGVMVNQKFVLKNSDPTLHNVNCQAKVNQPFNMGMPTKDQTSEKVFDKPEKMIYFKCDVHPWMGAYVGVVEHPFFAVSGADGRFEIKGLAPGSYTLAAWHEKYGEKTIEVNVPASASAEAAFSYSAS